ncbi:MAG: hypothetical protein HYR85_18215 [Planctomycetes bacterium]|nr:hypothetical protein [Planctomycetota bacterium]
MQHMVAAIAQGYAKARGKEPLFTSAKDGTTGKRVYTIEAKYREDVARILAELPSEPAAPPAPKRGPGRPRKAEMEPTAPKRGPGRPRKIDVAVENLIGIPAPRYAAAAKRTGESITLPFAKIPDLEFWMQLVAMANEAVRRGKLIRFVSDGKDVTIEVEG